MAQKFVPKSSIAMDLTIIDDPSSRSESSPSYSTEKTIAEFDQSFVLVRSRSETDVSCDSNAASKSASNESKKYLDGKDVVKTKKLLGKLCKTMVESTCHHGKQEQELNHELDKLEKAFADNISVLNDFVVDFDLKAAEKVEEMVERIDSKMTVLEEIASFSSALDSLEDWLDLIGDQNQRDLDTIERAKQNLIKEKVLQKEIDQLEEQSIKYRAVFDALELDDPRMLRQAVTESKKSANTLHYGVKENKNFVPEFMADIKDLETTFAEMKRFFVPSRLLPQSYFDKMDGLIDNVKTKMSERYEPLSAASSMASIFATTSSEQAFASDTSEYEYTQNSDASVVTAISPRSSSLKTAISLHDIISSVSMDSSSTIAI